MCSRQLKLRPDRGDEVRWVGSNAAFASIGGCRLASGSPDHDTTPFRADFSTDRGVVARLCERGSLGRSVSSLVFRRIRVATRGAPPRRSGDVPRALPSRGPRAREAAPPRGRIATAIRCVSQLARESEARAELLSVVSHELRTPLAVISGYSRLLLDERVGPLTEEQRRFVAESKRSCERLDALVTRLLGASTGKPGSDPNPSSRVARIEPIVEQVIGFFAPHFDERELELSLVRSIDPMPAVRLDRSRTEQVLTNLLGNALKYANPGGCVEIACAEPSPAAKGEDRGHGERRRSRDPARRSRARLRTLGALQLDRGWPTVSVSGWPSVGASSRKWADGSGWNRAASVAAASTSRCRSPTGSGCGSRRESPRKRRESGCRRKWASDEEASPAEAQMASAAAKARAARVLVVDDTEGIRGYIAASLEGARLRRRHGRGRTTCAGAPRERVRPRHRAARRDDAGDRRSRDAARPA